MIMKKLFILATICIVGCAQTNLANVQQENAQQQNAQQQNAQQENAQQENAQQQDIQQKDNQAKIVSVEVQGKPQNYTFNVGISSPDTGCEQYADWWEVLNQEGKLLYRRILAHSHVEEQPFERSGGPVAVSDTEVLIIRAHMNNSGYGITAFKGSVKDGFEETQIEADFASEVKSQEPQPSGCGF